MNSQGKNLFERALETSIEFGNRRSPNVIVVKNAVIIKRNFAGKDIPGKRKDGKPFVKKGRRFTWVLTEDLFNALTAEKGECTFGIWAFSQENPDLKVYTIEVNIKMESDNPPTLLLYTSNNGRTVVTELNSTNMGTLDVIQEIDIERVDLTLNPYDPEKSGHFTLWLRDLKLKQNEIEDSDSYWNNVVTDDERMPFGDPNSED